VAAATGVGVERAAELLSAASDSVRVAIVMERAKVDRPQAERALAAAGGRIAAALDKAKHG
jgi:N-acetylmuramic acid 6-phosphate (MurNAc-6-P) etherase